MPLSDEQYIDLLVAKTDVERIDRKIDMANAAIRNLEGQIAGLRRERAALQIKIKELEELANAGA
jgi:peptidoglycan hydrolase CwlO-like protein